jgi:hypothetical protein
MSRDIIPTACLTGCVPIYLKLIRRWLFVETPWAVALPTWADVAS